MANKNNAFFDNLLNGIFGPKGNMADWQHARRTYIDDNMRLLPKNKFLYHVYIKLDPVARSVLPILDKYNLEIGLLVKSADLPKFSATVETRNKYNRKKNIQTSIQYEPINITFHDDTAGITTAMLEAYYRYYYVDGNLAGSPGAYNKAGDGDNTYKGRGRNQYKFGLDNNISVPFIQYIEITQMARRRYTTYRLINPIISNWSHDSVVSGESTFMENQLTVAYEAVHYSRGEVEAGDQAEPTGFGSQEHYDKQPSPISLLGGGNLGLFGTLDGLFDLYNDGLFNNPLVTGLTVFNAVRNLENLSSDALREEGLNVVGGVLNEVAGIEVSGLTDLAIPKNNGTGGSNKTTSATSAGAGNLSSGLPVSGGSSTQYDLTIDLAENPIALNELAKEQFKKDYLADGGASINGYTNAWEALPEATKQIYRDKVLGTY